MLEALFSPIKIGEVNVKNRIYMPALTVGLSDESGNVTPQILDFYTERAKGGVGLIVVGGVYSDRRGKADYGMLAMDRDELIPQYRALTDAIKKHGSVAVAQILDAGRYASTRISGLEPVAPSAVPSRLTGQTPREMTHDEVKEYQRKIISAVKRAASSGFDGVELHAGMGYLISQFLSPFTNKRKDEYGGDIEGRMRFLIEIIEESKRVIPQGFVLGCRISMNEFLEGGNTEREGEYIVKRLDGLGVDYISVVAGWHESRTSLITQDVPPAGYVYLAEAAKRLTDRPVIYTTRVKDPYLADRIISEGKADMVGLGRALLADPYWPEKAFKGHVGEIRPCITCSHCLSSLFSSLFEGRPGPVECQVNPRLGNEGKEIPAAERKKRILVAGGGPAGLEAAITLARRGHDVVLVEREGEIGGMLIPASASRYKRELRDLINYYRVMLEKLNVRVLLNQAVTPQLIENLNADEIVVATGSSPRKLEVPGAERPCVIDAVDLLKKGIKLEGRVIVCGGGETGLEVADFLSDQGVEVTVVEMYAAGQRVELTERGPLFRRLREKGVKILEHTTLKEIREGEVILLDREGRVFLLPCNYLVNATGMEPNRDVLNEIDTSKHKVHVIGDCVKPRRIGDAIREGFEIGIKL